MRQEMAAQEHQVQVRADRVMRWGVLGMVHRLSHRPSEAFDDVARGKTRPWVLLLRRAMEAALAGATRLDAEKVVDALREALDIIWSECFTPRRHLRLLKPVTQHTELERVA